MKNILLLIVSCLLLISCKGYFVDKALEKVGAFDEKVKPEVFSNNEKRVVIIGMHHIGKQNFYDDVKFKIDSLRNLGFHFLYEATKYDSDFPEEQKYAYDMKFRKLMGFHLEEKGYLDTITNTIAGKVKVDKKHKLVNQPKYSELGLNSLTDEKADLPKNILLDKYEAKYGIIELDECDFKTKLEEEYKCSVWNKGDKNYLLLDARNTEVVNRILSSNNDKIAVLYGKKHISGILKLLQEDDSNWVEEK